MGQTLEGDRIRTQNVNEIETTEIIAGTNFIKNPSCGTFFIRFQMF